MKRWKQYWQSLTRLVWQEACPLCQRTTANLLCPDCLRQVQVCQLPTLQQRQRGQPIVFAWGHYSGALKQTIAALKYEQHPSLAQPLGLWLAQSWVSQPSTPRKLTVVPIPLHPAKQQQRGFNQAELLAEQFCTFTRFPLARHGLDRSRETIAQFQLSQPEREQNLAGAFTLGSSFRQRLPLSPVLLLDDIYTTGATAKSAAQTLRRHGISVYGIAVVARAQKRTR